MIRYILHISLIVIIIPTVSSAVNFGIGFDYSYGIPLNDLRDDHYAYYSYNEGGSYTYYLNEGEYVPIRPSAKNFALSLIFRINKHIAVEGGLDLNTGYRTDATVLRGVLESPFGEVTPVTVEYEQDLFNWRIFNYGVGCRYYPAKIGIFEPYINAGVSASRSLLLFELDDTDYLSYSDRGNHLMFYVGGAFNILFKDRFFLTFPVKFSFPKGISQYRGYYGGELMGGYAGYYRPPILFTFGIGLEVYVKKSDFFTTEGPKRNVLPIRR